MMNPELQRYYEDRLSMTGSAAWKDLMTDIEGMLAATNTLDAVHDEKSLHFKRGEVAMMRWMLSIAELSEKAYEDLKNETDV